jgi:hypothetical protein
MVVNGTVVAGDYVEKQWASSAVERELFLLELKNKEPKMCEL